MSIAIVVPKITERLSYTLERIFVKQLGIDYTMLNQMPDEKAFQIVISYGFGVGEMQIPCCGLLFEHTIEQQEISIGNWHDLPVLFSKDGADNIMPFDIFAAIFYCISRYEEYLPFHPDKHQRFPATESVLYRNDLLERPIVDEWISEFGKLLEKMGVKMKQKQFEFLPTYDIDIAWSYKNKGLQRTLGGYLKDVAANNFAAVQERTAVLSGNKNDPYFSFEWTDKLHERNSLNPLYFILAAAQNGPFDKHILPSNKNMRALIQALAARYKIGMHPSYNTNERSELFDQEQQLLAIISGQQINISRQHYIKFTLPETYRKLTGLGIECDYSMGYGTHLGFRAGTSRPFFWYDLKAEKQTNLQIYPFSFMDTTAHYELDLSADAAFDRLAQIKNRLEKVGGLLITVFHNFSLGTDKEWHGWPEAYADFIKQ